VTADLKAIQRGTRVQVEWDDSASLASPAWATAKDISKAAADVGTYLTVGFLHEIRRGRLVLTQTRGEFRRRPCIYDGGFAIPLGAIVRVRKLR
jgi:hypothetical protein